MKGLCRNMTTSSMYEPLSPGKNGNEERRGRYVETNGDDWDRVDDFACMF